MYHGTVYVWADGNDLRPLPELRPWTRRRGGMSFHLLRRGELLSLAVEARRILRSEGIDRLSPEEVELMNRFPMPIGEWVACGL